MTTWFTPLYACLEDLVDQVAEDIATVQTAIKSRGAGLGSKQRAALEGIRDEARDLLAMIDPLLGSSAVKSVTSLPTFDRATVYGTEVKAIGESGWVGGYALRFGDEQSAGDLSHHKDIFAAPPKGYYGRSLKSVPVYVHHGMLPEFGMQELTNTAQLEVDRVGLFVKHLLDLREPYEKALLALTKRGKLGFSTGALSHLVERKALSGGRNMISRWIIGELSYTPSPASGGGTDVSAMKSLLESFGIDATVTTPHEEPTLMQPAGPSGSYLVPFDAAEAMRVRAPTQWRAASEANRAERLTNELDRLQR